MSYHLLNQSGTLSPKHPEICYWDVVLQCGCPYRTGGLRCAPLPDTRYLMDCVTHGQQFVEELYSLNPDGRKFYGEESDE